MRDPLRPIPAPSSTSFWDANAPAPEAEAAAFDPMDILRGREGDSLGLDRRGHARARAVDSDCDGHARGQRLVRAAHQPVDGVLALSAAGGWALVRTLTLSPQGVLLHHLDAMDPSLDDRMRLKVHRILGELAPALGAPAEGARVHGSSPLANVGTHLLGERLVADAARWSHPETQSSAAVEVELMIPPQLPSSPLSTQKALPRVAGRLAPLNDPDPRVLAVALDHRSVQTLRLHLCG